MAIDDSLAARMRGALATRDHISEISMMGGLCFMWQGHMISGARREKDGLGLFMFRLGEVQATEALTQPFVMPAIMGQRRMKGFVRIKEAECPPTIMDRYLAKAIDFAATLPPKPNA